MYLCHSGSDSFSAEIISQTSLVHVIFVPPVIPSVFPLPVCTSLSHIHTRNKTNKRRKPRQEEVTFSKEVWMKAGRIRRIPVRSIKAHLWKAPSATVESRVSRLVPDPLHPRDDQTPTTSRANVSLLIQEQGSQYAFNLWDRTSPWRLMTCSF